MSIHGKDTELLSARLSDYADRSECGELSVSQFLAPAGIAQARAELSRRGIAHRAVFFGGYPDAERQVLFLLPSYTDSFDGDGGEKLDMFFSKEKSDGVAALKICGSSYRTLSHKDYLGSILSLGIEREVLGDIVIINDFCAVIFCSGKIAEFIKQTPLRIANDAVSVCDFDAMAEKLPERQYKRISGTVASPRLDCIVSALTGLSRESSQELIKKELCQLNYITESRCDLQIAPVAVLSLRGYGKYILRDIDGVTKKGRIRFSADKYI